MFRGTAWHYARYRPQYSEKLLNRVAEEFRLDGVGRLLDLGCGTGHLSIPLSRHFREVIGLDPEPEMLTEAARQSEELGIQNIRWIEGGSFDCEYFKEDLGKFELVTMGTSFHWMDRDATLDILADMVEPLGGIAVIGTSSVATIWQGTESWQTVTKAVIQKWLGKEGRAGTVTNYSHSDERHETIIARSRFTHMQIVKFQTERNLSIDDILGGLYSTTFASKPVLGDNQPAFEEELRTSLLKINPLGRFLIKEDHDGIFAWLR